MLSTNAFFFSRSANSRFEVNFPVVENATCPASFAGEPSACQGSSPQMPSGPVYGDCEVHFVPKQDTVIHPIAKAAFDRRSLRPGRPLEVACEVVRFATNNLAQSPAVNPLHHFYKRRAIADLETDIKTELPIGALADFDHLLRSWHVHSHWFSEI